MPFFEANGARLFYTDEGSGPPLLLVHGWSCDGTDWAWQTPALVAAGYRCIVPDLRGHGRSSVPEDGFTPQGYAADLAAFIAHLGIAPVVAIGHSMGGATVVALAVEHPETVRAIVPVDSAYGMTGAPAEMEALIAAFRAEGGESAAIQMFTNSYGPGAPAHLAAIHARRIMAFDPQVRWKAIAGMVTAPDQFCVRPHSEAYLQRVAVPALAFRAGREDPAAVAAWERENFQHSKSHVVAWENTGHWLHQERPEEFDRELLDWLARLD
jgi:pimeloyl-ACP methyl ester carboxylesterase